MFKLLLSLSIGYLIGSIPTAYIFGRVYKGIDIREHGSGNVGATNTFRVLGKVPGIFVLVIDILKGVVAVIVISRIFGFSTIWQYIVIGLCAVCGHNWTVFLQFKGGKGIATSLGVLIGLAILVDPIRPVLLGTVASWLIVFLASGYVSLASIIATIVLAVLMVTTSQPAALVALGGILCAFVILRHRLNIKRLLAGTENRVPLPHIKK